MPFDLDNSRNRYIYVLAANLLLGIFLRLYDLGKESLWRDEVYSIRIAELSLPEIFKNEETNPPLHFLLLHYWQKIFGTSEFAVRFPSLILGVLSILLIYQIGVKLFSQEVGVLSALILSLSSFHIHYSQEARAYALMVFLTLASNLFYINSLEDKKAKSVAGYIAATTLLAYSHVYALFIIIAQNIHFLSTQAFTRHASRWKIREWVLVQSAVVVLFLPWLNMFLSQSMGVVSEGFWLPEPGFEHLHRTILTYIGHRRLVALYALIILLALTQTGLKIVAHHKERPWKEVPNYIFSGNEQSILNLFFLLLWFAAPLMLPFLISQYTTPIYHTRYTIPASAAFYILFAVFIKNLNWRIVKAFFVCAIIGLSLLHTWHNYFQITTREQWREAAHFIETNHRSSDFLVFSTLGSIDAFDYYFPQKNLQKISYGEVAQKNEPVVEKKNIRDIITQPERIWAILDNFRREENAVIKEMMSVTHRLEKEESFRGVRIYLFVREPNSR